MNSFKDVLVSKSESRDLSLYSRFVGEWDFVWTGFENDKAVRTVNGEWIFSVVIDGNAVQDVFICPSREERKTKPQPDQDYGTTFRIPFGDGSGRWQIIYFSSWGAPVARLIAEESNGDIIQRGINDDPNNKSVWEWNFYNIKDDSFDWINRYLDDDGVTWHTVCTIKATKR